MQPTRLATQLYEGFKEASRSINDAVSEASQIFPINLKATFSPCLVGFGEIALLPRVLDRLNQMAPSIELDIVPLEIDQVATWLNDGHIDAAI